jgi:hypothetical protein
MTLRVSDAYAEAPRGIQQVRYWEKHDSKLSPLGSVRTPCQALQHRPLPVLHLQEHRPSENVSQVQACSLSDLST